MARLERAEDLGMGQEDALRVARRSRSESRMKRAPFSSIAPHRRRRADAQLRPLQVGEDRDRPPDVRLDLARHGADLLAQPVARRDGSY